MENYSKGKNVEEIIERGLLPFKDLPQNFLWMQVNKKYFVLFVILKGLNCLVLAVLAWYDK